MGIEIRQVGDDKELLAVGSLRYEVAVQEMKLKMRHADHLNRVVIEPLDLTGHVFAAWCDGELVGTVRQNLVKEAPVGEYFEGYGVTQLLAKDCSFVSVTTRLMIKCGYRHGRASLLLPMHAYNFMLQNGITHDVIDSRPHLLPFFRKLGYRTHLQSWGHPEFGSVIVQYLAVEDECHLRELRSPFLNLLTTRISVLSAELQLTDKAIRSTEAKHRRFIG